MILQMINGRLFDWVADCHDSAGLPTNGRAVVQAVIARK